MTEDQARIEVVAPPRFESTEDDLAKLLFGSNDGGVDFSSRYDSLNHA